MQGTLSQWLSAQSPGDREVARKILAPLADRMSSHCFTSAGLAIKTAGSALVKAGNITYAIAQGKLQKIAANTDMAALSGTVTNAKFNVFAFFIDSAGNLSSAMGTEATTLGGVVVPPPPVGAATIGYAIINPTGTGNFVGGTTPIDDATVVPNAAYINLTGPVDPSVLI